MEVSAQSEFGPTWHSGITPLPALRAALNYDIDVDVCVIGGGLAGLVAAREIVRRKWSVAVLEAKRVGWNASGRNLGVVVPGFSTRLEKIIERIGTHSAKALWALSETGVDYVRQTIAEFGAAGVDEGSGWLDVYKAPDPDGVLARLELLKDFGVEAEGWPLERIRDVLKSNRYFHAIHFPRTFVVNPLAYTLRLAEMAERGGAFIFEHTPVLEIDPAGVRKRIVTPQGRVRAAHVVFAGNVFLGAVAQRLADTLVPITSYGGVTRPIAGLRDVVGFRGAISDSRYANYHYRIVAGDRLLWTGGATTGRYGEGGMRRRFQRAIRATYPQLGPVEVERVWPGTMGFAIHRMPQVGEVERGVWLTSGYGAQGINTTAMGGLLVARGIVEGDDTWRQFLPYELVWAGGRVGRAVVSASMGWSMTREAIAGQIAWRREEHRRRYLEEEARRLAGPARPAYRELETPPNRAPESVLQRFANSPSDLAPIRAPEAAPHVPPLENADAAVRDTPQRR